MNTLILVGLSMVLFLTGAVISYDITQNQTMPLGHAVTDLAELSFKSAYAQESAQLHQGTFFPGSLEYAVGQYSNRNASRYDIMAASQFLHESYGHIDIQNSQSYPNVGEFWTVQFATQGTHDLVITAINGTTFGTYPDDVEFVSLADKNKTYKPEWVYADNAIQSVRFSNYSSDNVSSFKVLVNTSGKHHLKFEFGGDVAYADNSAVHSIIKIAHNTNGGPALADNDWFGQSLANIGDLNNDGIADIAVGALLDDTGGPGRGAVYIFFMNSNGTVQSSVKIAHNTNGGPVLADNGLFGSSVVNIGDRNNDGIADIAIGSARSNTGGIFGGAVHIFLMTPMSASIPVYPSTTTLQDHPISYSSGLHYLQMSNDIPGAFEPGNSYTIPNALNMTNTGAAGGSVLLSYQASTEFTRTDGGIFNRVLIMPEDLGVSCGVITPIIRHSLVSCTNVGGQLPISLDRPARILFSSQSANTPYFAQGGVTTQIINVCASDAPIGLVGNECAIPVGNDLAIWTNHFTYFGTSTLLPGGSSGGSSADRTPPSIVTMFGSTEYPVSIGSKQYTAEQLKSPVNTATIETEKPVNIELLLYDNSGPSAIAHVEMHVNMHGTTILNDLTETYLSWDKFQGTMLANPYGLISDGTVEQTILDNKALFTFDVSFAKEFDTSDIVFVVWDEKQNGIKVQIQDAMQVIIGEPDAAVEQKDNIAVESELGVDNIASDQMTMIKRWAGYDVSSVTDQELLDSLGIKTDNFVILSWVKPNLGKWVVEGKITVMDLITALENLESRYIFD